MQSIKQFITGNHLRPGDAVELICPVAGFPKHYTVYMGTKNGNPEFIANMMEGVKLVRDQELLGFLVKYQVTNIERFAGSEVERRKVVRKALSRLGEKAYSFVCNNCEHFKNWVLYGESKSHQVEKIAGSIALAGGGLLIAGIIADKKGLQKAGLTILIVLLIVFILAWWILKNKENTEPTG
jgi:hypothetical protein